ncbi:MAG: OsmC family protein [Streptosporangiaceae bacterium]
MPTDTPSATGTRERAGLRTTCGREVRVGRLALGGGEQPAGRVSLDIAKSPGRDDGTWAGLTPAEARWLAAALLGQAAAADRDARTGPAGPEQEAIVVAHVGGDAYAITTRGHVMLTDQPASAGGQDAAPTPTELLVAALASCVAFYAGRYLTRHGLARDGLRVTAGFTMAADRPARVREIRLRIVVPGGFPAERRAALLAVASHCTVHNTLRQEPGIAIDLA